ncbi:hypothetical protein WM11_12010 [Burkholderia ubonensis]|uniref:lanthionine synthetase LanC family protein n=1 Tax=Burkholderia ubonensis TaxID=101571 RepID=UPI00075CBE9B|nr:lanthionine synthetase LanC family protein [Burkholderia ubonensis]KWK06105.1 hypothetical protein WM11_12010 [Burkholderia ubonensis]KWK56600.1 hypothetical protein WM14_27505 [Burkholderia ubonensis]
MTAACPHAAHTLAALRCVSVPATGTIRWRGEAIAPRLPDGPGMDDLRIDLLAEVLYRHFYCHGRPLPLASGAESAREGLVALRLRAALVRANRVPPTWQGGWQAQHRADGGVDAERAGLCLRAPPGAWRPVAAVADTGVELRQESGTFAASPGFYLVEGPPWRADSRLVRLYWHVSPAGAAPLLAALTGMLTDSGLPFHIKVLARGTAYGRADACVLYLDQAHFPVLAGELARIHVRMRPWFDATVPVYTHALAPGLGLAEQPPTGASFGRHRCMLLARALCADGARTGSPPRRLEQVRAYFSDHGIALAQPFLNPGSRGDYVLPEVPRPRHHARVSAPAPQSGLLTAAARIGAELAGDAVWHDGRCCWVGHLSGTGRPFGALGPALYDGTAGIAWFLAQLYSVTGEARLRATAEGALRHACAAVVARAPDDTDIGLYTGLAGVAWVSARCADLLARPELAAQASRLRGALAGRARQAVNADVLGGVAGVVLGLLGAGGRDDDGLAHEYGAALLCLARRGPAYWTWTTVNGRGMPALTGFAHGAAGIASALAALYAATGKSEWQAAARAALAYEDACFDARAGNWLDFRSVRQRRFAPASSCAWCHGAGGVALARALAAPLLGKPGAPADPADPADQQALDAALATTRAAVRDALETDGALCLCHGLAGNADLLLLAGHTADRALAAQAAQHVLERYACTPAVERTPGLLTGSAGIGHFFLRLCDAGVSSPLWLGPAPT